MYISSKTLKQFNFRKGDTEGFVNYGLRIKEAELAAIFIENEEDKLIKISFRSKTNLDVNHLGALLISMGGGHIKCGGGEVRTPLWRIRLSISWRYCPNSYHAPMPIIQIPYYENYICPTDTFVGSFL